MGLELFDWYGGPTYDDAPVWPPEAEVQGAAHEAGRPWVRRLTRVAVSALKLPPASGKSALVLGRFDPPHVGHAFVIEAARSVTKGKVIVCVFVRRGDFLDGAARVRALQAMALPSELEVRAIEVDEHFPAGAPEVERWAAWFAGSGLSAQVQRLVSSDPAAAGFATAAGLELVLVDPARQTFPISSTAIRADPWAAWDALAPDLRPRFARLVGLIGPEGGGKTTVARALGAHFKTSVGHEYLERFAGGVGRALRATDLTGEVLAGHRSTLSRVRAGARRFGLVDSDVANLKLWHERLFPREQPMALSPTDWCHHYLVFGDHAWAGDPAKDEPEARRRMVHDAEALLEANGRSFELIEGPLDARLGRSIDALEAWVKTKPSLRGT